jgi:metal-responsive CopG/Arc/MetJ family transcriptional regulator
VELPSKPVRVNVMIPSRDLQTIDAYAKRHGMSRSGFLVTAARQVIAEASGR